VNFPNIKEEDLTPVLTIVIDAVNGIKAQNLNASGYMKIETGDLEKRLAEREAAERERQAAAEKAERERQAAAEKAERERQAVALAAAEWIVRSGHSALVNSAAFSPDGRQVISCSSDKTLKLWDVITGNVIRTFYGHSDYVYSVAFSPDGRQIISGSMNNMLKLWDVATGKVIRTSSMAIGTLEYDHVLVTFSPDGKRVIAGGNDALKLFDVATGSVIRTFSGYFRVMALSPDGKKVFSSNGDGYDNGVKLLNIGN
jgi:WD40 repeat protein